MKPVELMFKIMEEKNIKSTELADYIGVSKSVVGSWKSRNTNPPVDYIERICELLDISLEYFITGKNTPKGKIVSLYNKEEIKIHLDYHLNDAAIKIVESLKVLNENTLLELQKYIKFLDFEQNGYPYIETPEPIKKVKLLGETAAGEPIDLPYDSYNFSDLTNVPTGVKADFALRVKGDSMEPKIMNDEIILIKKQCVAENGQIVIASIDKSVTCKKYYKYDNYIELRSINKDYPPIIIQEDQDGQKEFQIIGIVLL